MYALSEGIIPRLLQKDREPVQDSVVQVITQKKIPNGERIRAVISDGMYLYKSVMFATALNELVDTGELTRFTVIKIKKYATSSANTSSSAGTRLILIIAELEILGISDGKIGNPVEYGGNTDNDDNTASTNVYANSDNNNNNNNNNNNQNSNNQNNNNQNNNYSNNNNNNNNNNSNGYNNYNNSNSVSQPKTSVPNRSSHVNPFNMASSSSSYSSSNNFLPAQKLEELIKSPQLAITSIDMLTPNFSNAVIRARVVAKSPLRSFTSKNNKEGKVFNVDLSDGTDTIRASSFNERHYSMLEPGGAYYFSKFTVKPSNPTYSTLKHKSEIQLESASQIVPCEDDSGVPGISYDFIDAQQLSTIAKDSTVDFIGVCANKGTAESFTSKSSNKQMTKREVELVDKTNSTVKLTLWGKEAEEFCSNMDDNALVVVVVKHGKVTDFNTVRSISCTGSTNVAVDPEMDEVAALKQWYLNERNGPSVPLPSVAKGEERRRETMKFLADAAAKPPTEPVSFSVKATILMVKKTANFYENCAAHKKKLDNGICHQCNGTPAQVNQNMTMSFMVGDHESDHWLQCFKEPVENMANCNNLPGQQYLSFDSIYARYSPRPVGEGGNENDYAKFVQTFVGAELVFNVRVKYDEASQKLQAAVNAALPVNNVKESINLVQEIKKLKKK